MRKESNKFIHSPQSMSLGIDGQRMDELRSAPRVEEKKIKILEKERLARRD